MPKKRETNQEVKRWLEVGDPDSGDRMDLQLALEAERRLEALRDATPDLDAERVWRRIEAELGATRRRRPLLARLLHRTRPRH